MNKRLGRKKRTRHDREIDRAVGKRIAERRREAGLVQVDIARKLELTESQVSRYENGATGTDAVLLLKLASALKCQPGDFFENLQIRNPK